MDWEEIIGMPVTIYSLRRAKSSRRPAELISFRDEFQIIQLIFSKQISENSRLPN